MEGEMVIPSRSESLARLLNTLAFFAMAAAAMAAAPAFAQTSADGGGQPPKFQYSIDSTLLSKARTYRETNGALHDVALARDDKGITTAFVEDEIVVGDEPAEIDALVSKYNARILRKITVNMISTDGKPVQQPKTPPMTVLQIDPSTVSLKLEDEAPTIKAHGVHAFSSAKSANLSAIFAHERAAGHAVMLNVLGEGSGFPTSSTEQPDQYGLSDAYQWAEFDHRAWQYVLAAGIKMHPVVAIIDGGFWLNSQGEPCGYTYDSLCQSNAGNSTTAGVVGKSDLPKFMLEGDATGGPGPAGGVNPGTCFKGASCPWHGNWSASVALGAVNNGTGAAGMGGIAAVPMLIKTDASIAETAAAVAAARTAGAQIISISSGGACGFLCQEGEAFLGVNTVAPNNSEAEGVVVVASAGNDSQDAGSENFWPCVDTAICVGAVAAVTDKKYNYFQSYGGYAASYSNYGQSVQFWGPTSIRVMPDDNTGGQLFVDGGTSASAPYVAGVVALMLAVNPTLAHSPKTVATLLASGGTSDIEVQSNGEIQSGVLVSPLNAVMAANNGLAVPPEITITQPTAGAAVGQNIFQPVTFSASVLDVLATDWQISGYSQYAWKPMVWTSDVDGQLGVGNPVSYQFSPTAKPGERTITAKLVNGQGVSGSTSVSIDFEPNITGSRVNIVYPPVGATFQTGTIRVRGSANTAVGLGYISCDHLVWQKGIASAPIPSTSYDGANSGICQADVPFKTAGDMELLKLTATDTTGKATSLAETLNIAAASPSNTVSIDDPTGNESFTLFFGQSVPIGLHAFAQGPQTSGNLTYTWSWYANGSPPSSKASIGVGQTITWNDNKACGPVTIEVVVTSPNIPSSASPTASKQINVICSSSG
jgi:hypothetical protein